MASKKIGFYIGFVSITIGVLDILASWIHSWITDIRPYRRLIRFYNIQDGGIQDGCHGL